MTPLTFESQSRGFLPRSSEQTKKMNILWFLSRKEVCFYDCAHLIMVPVGEFMWDLHPNCTFVQGEVEPASVALHCDVVPVLVI